MLNKEDELILSRNIDLVKYLIERCLQVYMTPPEIVNTLFKQGKIEPCFTEIVYRKLEEDNPEFFRAYYMKLVAKGAAGGRNILRSML